VGCDAAPDVSKVSVASILRIKQSRRTAPNLFVTRCVLAGDVATIL
jgi:hypothetical protein